jgi:non-homologous end joining protein Ku
VIRSSIISRKELDRLQPTRTPTIDIDQFIKLEEIDPIYLRRHLLPAAD